MDNVPTAKMVDLLAADIDGVRAGNQRRRRATNLMSGKRMRGCHRVRSLRLFRDPTVISGLGHKMDWCGLMVLISRCSMRIILRRSKIIELFNSSWTIRERCGFRVNRGNFCVCRDGQFASYEMPGKGTPFNYARKMCDDAEGHLWVVSCEWQLICFGKDGFTVPSANWSLGGVQPAAVANDQTGQVWVQTEQELAVRQKGIFQTMWSGTNEWGFPD